MRPMNFNPFPSHTNAPASGTQRVRSLFEAVASLNTPIAPGGDPDGALLTDVGPRGCRFPTRRDHLGTFHCNVEVARGAWRPGAINGCYCAFHRGFLEGQPKVNTVNEGVA